MKKTYLFLLCFSITTCLFAQLAYYPFSGNAGDSSGAGRHGTNSGATVTADRYGAAGKAFQFGGSASVDISAYSQLKAPTYTYVAWIKADELPANGAFLTILSLGESNADQSLMIGNNSIQGAIGFGLTTFSDDFTSARVYAGTQPDLSRWYQIVVSRATDSLRLYIDGIQVNSTSVAGHTATFGSTNYKASIGMRVGTSPSYFKGAIDDLRIYLGALTAAEITNLYSADFKKTLAYYPFNGNALDTSGNNRNATLSGPATFTTDRYNLVDRAYLFNGTNNSFDISYPELQVNRYTYSLWVRMDTMLANGKVLSLISIGDGNQMQSIIVSNVTGTILGYGVDCWNTNGTNITFNKDVLPELHKWNHIVVTRDGTKLIMYLDGIVVKSVNVPTNTPAYGVGPLKAYIGMKAGGTQYFKGALDEIRIYNYAFTQTQVTNLYNAEKPVFPGQGIQAYYPFTDDAGYDSTDNNRNATISGAIPTKDRNNETNAAYHFNGTSDYIDITYPAFNNLQRYSYVVWAKPDGSPAGGSVSSILSFGDVSREQGVVLSNQGAPSLGYGVESWSTDATSTNLYQQALPDAKWHQIIVTREIYYTSLYIDSLLIKTTALNNKMPSYGTSFKAYIGRRAGGAQYFKGDIDNVRIYNYPLSVTEIGALYRLEKPTFNGVEENERLWNAISIYPNPGKSSLHMMLPGLGNLKIKVYSIQGILVDEVESSSTEITIQNLKSGFYLCSFETEERLIKTVKALVTE